MSLNYTSFPIVSDPRTLFNVLHLLIKFQISRPTLHIHTHINIGTYTHWKIFTQFFSVETAVLHPTMNTGDLAKLQNTLINVHINKFPTYDF